MFRAEFVDILYFAALASVILLQKYEVVLMLVSIAIFFGLLLRPVNKKYVTKAIIFGLFMTVILAIATYFGVFSYSSSMFIVPLWTPMYWAFIYFLVMRI